MRSKTVKRAPSRTRRWLRSGDGYRVTLMTTMLVGVLMSVLIVATASPTSPFAIFFAQTRGTAGPAPDAPDHRTGSILFVSHKRMCEELRFDNISEQVLSVGTIDCDARFAHENDDDAQTRRSARTLMMLAAFKK